MLLVYLFNIFILVPFLFVFSILTAIFGPVLALIVMVMGGLYHYATLPTPNDLKVGAVPYVSLGHYSDNLIDSGLIGHGAVGIVSYDKIHLPLINNSPVTLYSVELNCQADYTPELGRSSHTSFYAYWTGRLAPGAKTDAIGFIREVPTDPEFIDPSTLKCKIGNVKYDRQKAMLALGSDNVQTLVESRYNTSIRELDHGDNWSTGRNEITITGAVSNGSTLPLYGVTFECYLDGKSFPKFSTKFESPVLPNNRRAFQVTNVDSHGYQARPRMMNTSCAVYSYDFGKS